MKFKVIQPSEKLKEFVHYYWVLEQDSPDEVLIPERVVPAGYLQMFFHYKAPFTDAQGVKPQSYFCGQLTRYHDVIPQQDTGMIAVVFYPYSAKAFTHWAINELTNSSVALTEIYGNLIQNLEEAIANEKDYNQKVELIEHFLEAQFKIANIYQYGLVKQAVKLIDESEGSLTIADLASQLCVGERHLERLFKKTVGISPKLYAQIVRFYTALQAMDSAESLTQVCMDYGYYDQAHFIREFKKYTGMLPKKYFLHKSNKLEEM